MNEHEDRMPPVRSHFLVAALALAIASSLGAALSAQEDSPTRWYDMRALHAATLEDPEGVDLRLPLASSFLDRLVPNEYDVPLEERFSLEADDWGGLVENALGEDWPDDELSYMAWGGFLQVDGNARTQAAVQGIIADLKRHFARTMVLEIVVLPPATIPAGTGAVLTAAEVDALLAHAVPLDYSRKTTRPGQRVRLGGEGISTALVDYDVEVAQQARIADPVISVLRDGIEVGAIARPRLGGGFLLRAWGRRSVPDSPPRKIVLEHFANVELELPASSSTLCVGSAAIPDGGGLLFLQDQLPGGAWLIRARSDSPGGDASQGARFLSLAEVTAAPLYVPSPSRGLPLASPSGGWERGEDAVGEHLGDKAMEPAFTPYDVLDMLQAEDEELARGESIVVLDHAVYVRGSEYLLQKCATTVRELTTAMASDTVELDVRWGLLDHGEARRLVGQEVPAAFVDRLEHRLLGGCRVGDTLLLTGGRERFYLKDHDMEIAHAAAIPDPIIESIFEGVSLWCRPTRGGESTFSTWIDLRIHAPAQATREEPILVWEPRVEQHTEGDPISVATFTSTAIVELPSTARAGICTMVRLEEGEWTLLCDTGLAGTERALVAIARARTR